MSGSRGTTGVYCLSETPRCQNAKNRRKFDLFIPCPSTGRTSREDGGTYAHGTRLSEVGKRGKKETERGKEEERSFKKTRPPGYAKPRNAERSVARRGAARNKSRAPFTTKNQAARFVPFAPDLVRTRTRRRVALLIRDAARGFNQKARKLCNFINSNDNLICQR